ALANGNFFGATIGRSSLLALALGSLAVLALAAALRLLYRTVQAWWGDLADAAGAPNPADAARSLFVAFWGSALVIGFAINALSTAGITNSPRYLTGAW